MSVHCCPSSISPELRLNLDWETRSSLFYFKMISCYEECYHSTYCLDWSPLRLLLIFILCCNTVIFSEIYKQHWHLSNVINICQAQSERTKPTQTDHCPVNVNKTDRLKRDTLQVSTITPLKSWSHVSQI